MRQVATVGQAHTEDGIVRLQQREKYRGVGLRTRVRLYVGIIGVEQFLYALQREGLSDIDVLAASTDPWACITLGLV